MISGFSDKLSNRCILIASIFYVNIDPIFSCFHWNNDCDFQNIFWLFGFESCKDAFHNLNCEGLVFLKGFS